VRDAASKKKRKRDGPITHPQAESSLSAASTARDANAGGALIHMPRHKAPLYMPTAEVYLMHYGRLSKMENTLTLLVPIKRYGRLLATRAI